MSQTNLQKFYDSIHVTPNPDGTFTRSSNSFPKTPPSTTDPTSPTLSKDVLLDSEKNTWVRVFLPRGTLEPDHIPGGDKKLPVVVFVHGGGFVIGSPDYPPFHEFCSVATRELHALVVSVGYRLAPEHRLPAAYDVVFEALTWVNGGEDEWVREFGDLSNCVLIGESAGANIVYQTGLKYAAKGNNGFSPPVIKGLVLVQPFFGGLERSGSETRLANDPIISLEMCDAIWGVCLPDGADRDHGYCDPCRDGGSGLVDRVREMGLWVVIVGCDGDPLYDRGVELAKLLESKGVNVRTMSSEGGKHGMYVGFGDLKKSVELLDFVKHVWV